MEWQSQKGVLIGRDSGKRIQLGDNVRAKIINTQIDHLSMKIAVTMRDTTHGGLLGTKKWIKESKTKGESDDSSADSSRRIRKKRRKKKRE